MGWRQRVPKWPQNFESAPLWPLRYLSVWNFQFHTGQISNGSTNLFVESTSHTPPEDRQARLSGAGWGYSRQGEISPLMHTVHICFFCTCVHHNYGAWFDAARRASLVESTSHSQLGGRGACSPDAELANHRRRRYISPLMHTVHIFAVSETLAE